MHSALTRPLSAALLWLGLVSSTAAAQPAEPPADSASESAAPHVVLLVPDSVRAEWAAALQLELAARGGLVSATEPPEAPTALIGDAAAQLAARTRSAQAAVWLEDGGAAFRLRLIDASAEVPRVTPLSRDVDPRTVALIIVSLMDGASLPAPAAVAHVHAEAAPAVSTESTRQAAPAALTPPETERGAASDDEAETPTRRRQLIQWSGRVGLGMWLFGNDTRADLGGALRGGFGVTIDQLEIAFVHDVGFHTGVTSLGEPQAMPVFRSCLDGGARFPLGSFELHLGVTGCGGTVIGSQLANVWPFRLLGPLSYIQVSAGGYVSASFALESWIHLHVRGELQGAWNQVTHSNVDLVPTLLTFVSFS